MIILEIIKKYWKIITPIILIMSIFLFFVLFFSIPRLEYRYDNNYELYRVTKCYGDAATYKIKDDGKKGEVGIIGTRAFYKKNIKNIVFENPMNIDTIERLAFSECKNLENIDLSYVKYFERNCFSYCKKLKVEKLSAIDIGASAFYGCESISNIEFSIGLKTIGSYAFSKTNIEVLNLPSSVNYIYNDAFSDMTNLKEINVYLDSLNNESIDYLDSLNENIKVNYL